MRAPASSVVALNAAPNEARIASRSDADVCELAHDHHSERALDPGSGQPEAAESTRSQPSLFAQQKTGPVCTQCNGSNAFPDWDNDICNLCHGNGWEPVDE